MTAIISCTTTALSRTADTFSRERGEGSNNLTSELRFQIVRLTTNVQCRTNLMLTGTQNMRNCKVTKVHFFKFALGVKYFFERQIIK